MKAYPDLSSFLGVETRSCDKSADDREDPDPNEEETSANLDVFGWQITADEPS